MLLLQARAASCAARRAARTATCCQKLLLLRMQEPAAELSVVAGARRAFAASSTGDSGDEGVRGSGRFRSGLEGAGSASTPSPQRSEANGRVRVLAADREFLASGTIGGRPASGRQVLLHDHRDLPFLKKVTAAGVAGSLMSSSGLAYAVSMDLSLAFCGGLLFQTVGSALMLMMYLRTYVARAVLDPRRARLSITGCGLFGEVLTTEQHVYLAAMQPGFNLTDGYIKFRPRGSLLDPASWFWYRMPRAQADGADRKIGAQIGFIPTSPEPVGPAEEEETDAPSAATSSADPARPKFLGAGLGGSAAFGTQGGAAAWAPRAPGAPGRAAAADAAESSAGQPQSQATTAKSLASLRLHHGLPADPREEQKVLDFLSEPMAYGAGVRA